MQAKHTFSPLALVLGLTLVLLGTVAAQASSAETAVTAAEWRVCPAGPPDCDYAIIQDAVDAAADGDVIKVAGGFYDDLHKQPWGSNPYYPYTTTQIAFVSKTLTIRGGYATGAWSVSGVDTAPTILDAQGLGRGIYIVAQRDVTLEDLTIVRGYGAYDGLGAPRGGGGVGAEEYYSGTLAIRRCEIMSNTAVGDGGGLFFHTGNLVLEDTEIISNTASSFGGGAYVREADLTMTGNLITRNTGNGGGGMTLYESTAHVEGNTFRGNRSNWDGGGLDVTWGDITLADNSFLDNSADGRGGGINTGGVGDGDTYLITRNLIEGNVACVGCSGQGGGAQISGGSGSVEFSYNDVISNVAAAVEVDSSRGTGGGLAVYGPARVMGNLFRGNRGCTGQGCGGYGGALSLKGNIWVDGNRILDNWVSEDPCAGWCNGDVRGGGVAIHNQSRVTMTNNILAGNHFAGYTVPGKDNAGGAIYLGGQTDPTDCAVIAYHNTIAGNQSPAILSESGGLNMSHSILSGHDTDIETVRDTSGVGPVPVTVLDYTLWWLQKNLNPLDGSVISTTNDLFGDPDYRTFGGDDYHLGLYSEAVDRGPGVGVGTDIDGHSRPHQSRYDLGADEALRLHMPLAVLNYYGLPEP